MRIASLHLYPVKSTAPYDVRTATVEPGGLADDRRWLVFDPTGAKIDAKRVPRILTVRATPTDAGLLLRADGHRDLAVAVPSDAAPAAVTLSRQPTLRDAGPAAATWLSSVLGTDVRLGWQDDPAARGIARTHGGADGDALSLADTAPILLTTTASLDRLNAWIAEDDEDARPLPIDRFRPNVVVDGDLEPFVEDGWRDVLLGDVPFRFTELCDRCAITTIDPATLTRGKEPIRTLARRRQWDHMTWFGVRMAPRATGTLSVGDAVTVLESAVASRA